jgi:DNA polymerase-3 subunit gamma/tau
LVGQQAISTTLSHAIELKQVAHAYLFTGPRGTGKTSSARIFAKSLNCQQGPSATPCQTCDSCLNITAGNDLDVIEFDAASNNGVDQAKELVDSSQFAALRGAYKIYIIDEVHMLSTAAFNALLKTLEEPPPNVVFIFATTEAHKVLPTIVSRCQRFDFKRIATRDIEGQLAHVCQQEALNLPPDVLGFLARQAQGGLRDALSLLDQVSVLVRSQTEAVTLAQVAQFLGCVSEETLLDCLQALGGQQGASLLQQLNTLQSAGVEPLALLKGLNTLFRGLLVLATCGPQVSAELLGCAEDTLPLLQAQVPLWEPEVLPQALEQLQHLEQELKRSANPQARLEVGLLALCLRQSVASLAQLSQRLEALEAQVAKGTPTAAPSSPTPKPLPRQAAAPPVANATPAFPPAAYGPSLPPSLGEVAVAPPPMPAPAAAPATNNSPAAAMASTPNSMGLMPLYQQMVEAIRSPSAKALFQQHGQLMSVEGTRVIAGVRSPALLAMLQKPDKQVHLQKAAEAVLGQACHLTLQVMEEGSLPATEPVLPPPPTLPPAAPPSSAATTPLPNPLPTPLPAALPASPLSEVASAPLVGFEAVEPLPVPETLPPPAAAPPPNEAPAPEGDPAWEQATQQAQRLLQAKPITTL